jgi:hypothetical protein
MASAYFSASIPAVHGLGQRLGEIASTVASGAVFPGANGAEAYGELVSALGDFKDDWDNAVARLEEQTRGLGEATTAAATTMAEHDAGLAAAYQGS